jgi:hypothetical protein
MSRPSRRNKPYKPRKVDAGAVLAIVLKTQVIDSETCDRKELQLLAAVEALRTGAAYDEHIDRLCDAVNLVAKRCEAGDVLEAFPAALKGREALASILDRAKRVGRWGASGEELTALSDAVAFYVAVMRVSTHLEMRDACNRIDAEYRRDRLAARR